MSEGRESPDNTGTDPGANGSAMPPNENEPSKKTTMRPAFDDGALRVMEDEFQVSRSEQDINAFVDFHIESSMLSLALFSGRSQRISRR